jgi:hypothetical protein
MAELYMFLYWEHARISEPATNSVLVLGLHTVIQRRPIVRYMVINVMDFPVSFFFVHPFPCCLSSVIASLIPSVHVT